jgi:superfamily II helicase
MTLLRVLFIAGKASVKEHPTIVDSKTGEALITLLDQAGEFLDNAKGFAYTGEVVMRGSFMRLVDMDQDLDDVLKALDPRFKPAIYSYSTVPSLKEKQIKDTIKVELSMFVLPETQNDL